MTTIRIFLASAALAVVVPSSVHAAPPWAEGVAQATQDQANTLFAEGNQLFAEGQQQAANEKYRAAIALWDHPLIRFNLAVTFIRLEKPIEASDQLEKALRYGEQPFKKELYQQALDYQALLKAQVGYVEASCTLAGVKIRVDGQPWFDCPGKQTKRVLAGEHIVDGELKDYVPANSGRLVVAGGVTTKHEVVMRSLDSAVVITYKYPRWIPFTVMGAGAAISLVGLGVWLNGRSQMADFEDEFAMACPMGCDKDLNDNTLLRDLRDGAELKGSIGIGMMIGGGAVAVTGVVMTIMNKATRELPKLEVAPTSGGMSASAAFHF